MSTMSRLAGAAALALAFQAECHGGRHRPAQLQTPVTPVAREIYDLHLLML
jgi:hypothetical protein